MLSKRQALAAAFIVNTAFLLVEAAAAYLTGSLTLAADAGHMLTDSISIGAALLAAWIAARPSDGARTYGYQRAEVIAGFVNGLFLLGVVGYTVATALMRLGNPPTINGTAVAAVGVAGLAANLIAAGFLHTHRDNINVRGAFIHLIGDALGSVAAIVAGLGVLLFDMAILDPIAALIVAAIILASTISLLRDSANILLQGVPDNVSIDEVRAALSDVNGVTDVHHVHVWAMNSECAAVSAHIVTGRTDTDAVLADSKAALATLPIEHSTLQIETRSRGNDCEPECSLSDDEKVSAH